MPESVCPYCGTTINAATNFSGSPDARPDPGDVTTCMSCGKHSSFDADLKLVPISEEEMASLPPELQRALALAAIFSSITTALKTLQSIKKVTAP